MLEKQHVMLEISTPKFSNVRNCTTDVSTWLSIKFWYSKKAPLVPNMGKHRAKQKLEIAPPRKLETVPLLGGGGESDP